MRGTLNVLSWEKNGPVLHWPQVWGGNQYLMIGN